MTERTRHLLIAFLIGLGIGIAGSWAVADSKYARWRLRVADAMAQNAVLTEQLTALRDSVLSTPTRVDTMLVVRVQARIDTLLVEIQNAASLEDCQEDALALATSCRRDVDSLKAQVDTVIRHRARDSVVFARVDSGRVAENQRLRELLLAAPSPPKKWLNFLPQPTITAGLGCAGGYRFGCGIAIVGGFSF